MKPMTWIAVCQKHRSMCKNAWLREKRCSRENCSWSENGRLWERWEWKPSSFVGTVVPSARIVIICV